MPLLPAFKATVWAGVIPRLCFTGFTFAQPFLLNTVVQFLGSTSPDSGEMRLDDSRGVVGGLVAATA